MFILDFVTCAADIELGGFDIYDANLLISGWINHQSASSCPFLSNQNSGVVSFLSLLDTSNGNHYSLIYCLDLQWIQILLNSPTIQIKKSKIVGQNIISTAHSDTEFKIYQSGLSDGHTMSTWRIDNLLIKNSPFSQIYEHDISVDLSGAIYIFLNLQTDFYSDYQDIQSVIISMKPNFVFKWAQRILTQTGAKQFKSLDLALITSTSQIMLLSQHYSNTSLQYNSVNLLSASTGGILNIIQHQSPFSNSKTQLGQLKLSSDQSIYTSMIIQGEAGYLTFQRGGIQQQSITLNIKTDIILSSPSFVLDISQNIIVTGILDDQYQAIIIINPIDLTVKKRSIYYQQNKFKDQLTQSQRENQILKGSLQDVNLYSALNEYRLYENVVHKSVILSSVDISNLNQMQEECYPYLNYSIVNQYSKSLVTLMTSPTSYIMKAASLQITNISGANDLVSVSQNLDSFSLMPDYVSTTDLTFFSPAEIVYTNQDANGNLLDWQVYKLSNQDCNGQLYKVISLAYLNGTKLPSYMKFDLESQKLSIKMSNDQIINSIGMFSLKVVSQFRGQEINNYLRIKLVPSQALQTAAATSSVQTTYASCDLPIYPLYYGGSKEVNTKFFDFDSKDYIMMAGSSTQSPFNDEVNYISSGFLALIDSYGMIKWTYKVNQQNPNSQTASQCFQMAESALYYIGLCQTQSINYVGSSVTSYLRISKSTGLVDLAKEILTDRYDIPSQTPLYALMTSDSQLYVAMKYSTNAAVGLALISVNVQTSTNNYMKFYPGAKLMFNYDFLLDGSSLLCFKYLSSYPLALSKITLQTGGVSNLYQIMQGLSNGVMKTAISATSIYVPILSLSTSDIVYLYKIARTDYTLYSGVKISLSSSLAIQSVGVLEDLSGAKNIYLICSGSSTVILKLTSSFVLSENFYKIEASTSMNLLKVKIANGGIMFGTSGIYSGSTQKSTMIYFLGLSQTLSDNCFDMQSDSSLFQIDTTSSIFTDTFTSLSLDNYYVKDVILQTDTGIYEDSHNLVATSPHFGSTNAQSLWGLNLIPNKYHKSPNNLYQCGGYARQSDIKESTFSYTYNIGTNAQTISLTAPDNSCQGRTQIIQVSYHPNLALISTNQVVAFNKDTNVITIQTNGIQKSVSFSLTISYLDQYSQSTNYEFSINIQILSTTALVVPVPAGICSKKVYPMSFGGGCSQCDMTVTSFAVDSTSEAIYLGGSANYQNSFISSVQFYKPAFLMKISNTGLEQWVSQLQLSSIQDQIQSMALGASKVYAYLNSRDGSQYALIKLDNSNGRLLWAKMFDPYIQYYKLFFQAVKDIKIDPSNVQNLALAALYSYNGKQTSGFILANDNSNVVTSSFMSMIDTSSQTSYEHNVGQIAYDSNGAFISTHIRHSSQNGQVLVNKFDRTTPTTVSWKRSYEIGNSVINMDGLNPAIVIDGGSPYNIYVCALTTLPHVIKISATGTTAAHVIIQMTQDSVQTIDVIYYATNSQVLVLAQAANSMGLQLLLLDSSLGIVSNQAVIYDGLPSKFTSGKIAQLGSSGSFFYSYNVGSFGHKNEQVQEIVLNKRSLDLTQSNQYDCNKEHSSSFTPALTSVALKSEILVSIFVNTISWVTLDVGGVAVIEQQNNLQRSVLPNSMEALVDQQLTSSSCDGNTGTRLPELQSYAATYNYQLTSNADTLTINPNTYFQQCQGIETTSQLLYSEGKAQSETLDSTLLQISSMTVSVHPSQAIGYTQRQLMLRTCIKGSEDKCSDVDFTFDLNPSPAFSDPRIEEVCSLSTDYPKVLGNQNSDVYVLDSDFWTTNSQFVSCGFLTDGFFASSSYLESGYYGYIMTSNDKGQASWSYTVSSKSSSNTLYTSCKADSTNDVIYGLISIVDQNDLAIVKHSATSGVVQFSLALNGSSSMSLFNRLYADVANSALYVTSNPSFDIEEPSFYSQFLHRIDTSNPVLTYSWSRKLAFGAAANKASPIASIAFSSTNVYSVGSIAIGSSQYVNLRKISTTTGQTVASNNYAVQANANFQHQIIFDGTNVYVLYQSYQADSCTKFLSSYSSSLVVSTQKSATLTQAMNQYYSSVDYDSTYIYEAFSLSDSAFYLAKYTKASLTASVFKQQFFNSKFLQIRNVCPFTSSFQYLDYQLQTLYFLHFQIVWQAFYWINTLVSIDMQSAVIFSLDLSLVTTNPCITLNDVSVTFSADSQSSVDLSSYYQDIASVTSLALSFYSGLEWEMNQDFADYSFENSVALNCKASGLSLSGLLEDQIVVVPATGSYDISLDNVCSGTSYTVTLAVDGKASVPAFITSSTTASDFSISFAPAVTDIGLYRVRIRFQNSNGFVEKTFNLDVYPESYYGYEIVEYEFSCPTQFMHWHDSDQVTYIAADVDPSSQNFIICGSKQEDNLVDPVYKIGYISQMNKGFATLQHLKIDLNPLDTIVQNCFYGYQGNIQSVSNQWILSRNYIDTILLMKHSPKMKFLAAKQFKSGSGQVSVESYATDNDLGNQFLAGKFFDFDLAHSPAINSYLMMVDKDYSITNFKIFKTGSNGYSSNIAFSNDLGVISQILGYQNSEDSKYYWSVAQTNMNNFKIVWHKSLKNYHVFQRDQLEPSLYQQDLQYFNSNLYSCFSYNDHQDWTFNKYEPENGQILTTIEMSRESNRLNGCEMTYYSSEEVLILTLSFYEETYLIGVNLTDSNNSVSLLYSRVLELYTLRLTPILTFTVAKDGVFYLLSKAMSFDDSTEHFFFTQASSLTKAKWDAPCTNSSVQIVAQNSVIDSLNPIHDWLKSQQDDYWVNITIDSRSVYAEALNSLYMSGVLNTDFLRVTSNEELLKETYGGCLGNHYPKLPVEIDFTGSSSASSYGSLVVTNHVYDQVLPVFPQCSNDLMTYSVKLDNAALPSWINFDAATRTIHISPNLQSYAKSYTINYFAMITDDNTIISQQDLDLLVTRNHAPTALLDYEVSFTLSTSHSKSFTVTLDSDIEQDTAQFDADLLNASGVSVKASNSWFTIDSSTANEIKFSATSPTYNQGGSNVYTIKVSLFDEFNTVTPNYYYIYLTIRQNEGATLFNTVSRTLASSYLAASVSYTIAVAGFTDIENDSQTVHCTASATGTASTTWVTYTNAGNGDLTIAGQIPSTSTNIATYTFSCSATDQYGKLGTAYPFTLQVVDNAQITVVPQNNIRIVYNNGPSDSVQVDLSGTCSDSQNEALTQTLTINGNAYDSVADGARGLNWNSGSMTLGYTMSSNSATGVYTIALTCNDNFHAPSVMSFTITAAANQPITAASSIPAKQVWLADTSLNIVNPSTFFTDPEGYEISVDLRETGQASYPLFITAFDDTTDTITLSMVVANVGSYNMELVATDSIGQVTIAPFILTVKQCFTGCATCTDATSTGCLTCSNSFYFYSGSCGTNCPGTFFKDNYNNKCTQCPIECATCSGSNNIGDCTVCQSGYYFQNGNSCLQKCSPDYWGNPSTFTCTQLNTASYSTCLAFVDMMETTGSYKSSMASLTGSTIDCTGNSLCSDGSDGENGCSWSRKFAAQCTYASDQSVMISIMTNTLPNHCMYSGDVNLPSSTDVRFSVAFNVQKSLLVTIGTMTTSAQVNAYLCGSTWQSTLSSAAYKYSILDGSTIPFVGVALNGVLILTGNSAANQDAFYPKTISLASEVEFDSCLGSATDRSFYNYLSFSPCIFDSTPKDSTIASSCTSIANCNTDPLKYSYQYLTALQKVIRPIGIARDGHMIMGPFSASSALWQPCDVDICNGLTYNGNYVYAVTMFHPYTIGCWGPSQSKNLAASCTSQTTAVCSDASFKTIFLLLISLISIIVMIL